MPSFPHFFVWFNRWLPVRHWPNQGQAGRAKVRRLLLALTERSERKERTCVHDWVQLEGSYSCISLDGINSAAISGPKSKRRCRKCGCVKRDR